MSNDTLSVVNNPPSFDGGRWHGGGGYICYDEQPQPSSGERAKTHGRGAVAGLAGCGDGVVNGAGTDCLRADLRSGSPDFSPHLWSLHGPGEEQFDLRP